MKVLSQARHAFLGLWDKGGMADENYDSPLYEENESSDHDDYEHETQYRGSNGSGSGMGGLHSASRLRPLNQHAHSRDKNIYTLRPKNLEETAVAADYLKSGSAVIVNHELVDHTTALRIVDFMSGVCYGLENQGHAMKLGETIFLFTPGDYEINSDEVDYSENQDHFFRSDGHSTARPTANNEGQHSSNASASVSAGHSQKLTSTPSSSYSHSVAPSGRVTSHIGAPHVERRSWDR